MGTSYEAFIEEILKDSVLSHLSTNVKTSALNVIAQALYISYKSHDLKNLIERCEVKNEGETFSKHICAILDRNNISEEIWGVIREIIGTLPVSPIFINKLTRFQDNVYEFVVPVRIRKHIDFNRALYVAAIDKFKTSFRSVYSLRAAFMFVHRFLEKYNFNFRVNQFLVPFTQKDVVIYCKNDTLKLYRLQMFLNEILNQTVPKHWFHPVQIKTSFVYVTTQDVKTIYNYVRDKPMEELIFLLLLTTDLKTYLLNKIKVENVVQIKDYNLVIRPYGFIEGKKLRKFIICPRVAKVIETYMLEVRPSVPSDFLFLRSHTAIDNFIKRILKKTGLQQKKFRPSIFGVTYARSLAQCGNSSEEVLNCLQALVKTTQTCSDGLPNA